LRVQNDVTEGQTGLKLCLPHMRERRWGEIVLYACAFVTRV